MSNAQRRARQSATAAPLTAHKSDMLSRLIDGFDRLSTINALWIVSAIALGMVATIFWDFLAGSAVLLYADIGSDSVNIFYPQFVQMSKLWQDHHVTTGFSLETVMGMPSGFNVWNPGNWLIAVCGPDNVPYTLAYVEMLKMLTTSLLAFGFFHLQGLRNSTTAVATLCMTFSGYAALGASGWYVHSLEVTLLALGLFATEYALQRKRLYFLVLPASIAVIAYNNTVFIIYLAATLLVYTLIRVAERSDWKQHAPAGAITALLLVAGLAAAAQPLLGLRTQISESGRAESIAKAGAKGGFGTSMDVGLLDVADAKVRTSTTLRAYSNTVMGSGNAYKGVMNFLEGPLLYYGLPMLLFIPFFLAVADPRRRIVYGVLVAVMLILTFVPWFRFAFWNFKLDYFREYTMLIGAALLIVSMQGLDRFLGSKLRKGAMWIPAATSILALIILHTVGSSSADVSVPMRTTISILLAGFTIACALLPLTQRSAVTAALMVLTIADLTINAQSTINDRTLVTTAQINGGRLYGDDTRRAVEWIKQHDKSLYRIVKINPSGPAIHPSLNDAMVMGFNGLIGYSSWHNRYYLRFMEELGMIDRTQASQASWVAGILQRPYLASILGGKYIIRTNAPFGFNPYLYPSLHQIGNAFVSESKVALPLLVAYDRFVTIDQLRTLAPLQRDLQLFNTVVLTEADAQATTLPQESLAADTSMVMNDNILAMASERRSRMTVQANAAADGVQATIGLQRRALVVAHIPYDPNLQVSVNGKPVRTVVANIGFLGFSVDAGQHRVDIRYVGK